MAITIEFVETVLGKITGATIHIKYNNQANIEGATDTWQEGQNFMGIATSISETAPNSGYEWIQISKNPINNLESDSVTEALTAFMGKWLNENKVDKETIIKFGEDEYKLNTDIVTIDLSTTLPEATEFKKGITFLGSEGGAAKFEEVETLKNEKATPFKVLGQANESFKKGDKFKALLEQWEKLPNPSEMPPGYSSDALAYSSDGTMLAAGSNTSPYLTIYKIEGDTYTKLPKPSETPPQSVYSLAYNPDGSRLAVGHHTSPYLTIYKIEGDTYTKLPNPSHLPAGTGYSLAYSPDGTMLAVGSSASPFITIYKIEGDTYTKYTFTPDLPGTVYALAYSPDGTRLIAGHGGGYPYITIYTITENSKYARGQSPLSLPTNHVRALAYSPDGSRLAVGHENSPYITIYDVVGETYTKLPTPSSLPMGIGYSLAYSSDGSRLAVGHSGTSRLTIYNTSTKMRMIKTDNTLDRSYKFFGSALKDVNVGEVEYFSLEIII